MKIRQVSITYTSFLTRLGAFILPKYLNLPLFGGFKVTAGIIF